MAENKEGMSVQEIENLGKKYRFEIFFVVYFIVAALFNPLMFSMLWKVYLAALGGILGVIFPAKMSGMCRGIFRFVFKQEKITQLILACVGIVVAFFLAPVIFLVLGLMGGTAIHTIADSAKGPEA